MSKSKTLACTEKKNNKFGVEMSVVISRLSLVLQMEQHDFWILNYCVG